MKRLLMLAGVLALALGACGDDEKKTDSSGSARDMTFWEGPSTSKIHDLNMHMEAWNPHDMAPQDQESAEDAEPTEDQSTEDQ